VAEHDHELIWDFRGALANGSRRTPEVWEPIRGDIVAGVVVATGRTAPSRFRRDGAPYVDIKIQYGTKRGTKIEKGSWIRVHCAHAQLAQMVAEDKPGQGDRIAIEYKGLETFRDGTKRHVYTSVVEPPPVMAPTAATVQDSPWT
jgi:hypothetical protein